MKIVDDITAFHRAGAVPALDTPGIPSDDRKRLRMKLIREEVGETLDALEADDLVEIADGLADSIVVLVGTALEYGIGLEAIWDAVHQTNMAKFPKCKNVHCNNGNVYVYARDRSTAPCKTCNGRGTQLLLRDDGKVLKPEGWEAPDLATVLEAQGAVLT